MEENIYPNEQQQAPEMGIIRTAEMNLAGAAKWAKFIAIMGFVGAGFVAILALTAGAWMSALNNMSGSYSMMGTMGAGGVTLTYLITALFYFLLALYLYRFATRTQQALLSRSSETMADAFGQLKALFHFYGVLLIIALVFVALVFVVAIVGGIAAAAAF